MARYRPYAKVMASMCRDMDELLSPHGILSANTEAWIARREELDIKRHADSKQSRMEIYVQAWKDDRVLWAEFFEKDHGEFPGLTETELVKLLHAPEPELEPIANTAARRMFGPKPRVQATATASNNYNTPVGSPVIKGFGKQWDEDVDAALAKQLQQQGGSDEAFARKLQLQEDSDETMARKLQWEGTSVANAIDVDREAGVRSAWDTHRDTDSEKARKLKETRDLLELLLPKDNSNFRPTSDARPINPSDAFNKLKW